MATYYVDPINGNDSNSGSSDSPWKNPFVVFTRLNAGDTLILRQGVYPTVNSWTWKDYHGGTQDNPIKVIGDGNVKIDKSTTNTYSCLNLSGQGQPIYVSFDNINFNGGYYAGRISLSYVDFRNCTFTNCTNDGFKVIGSMDLDNDWSVTNGNLINCQISGFSEQGLDVTGGNDWYIEDVVIHSNGTLTPGKTNGFLCKNNSKNLIVKNLIIRDLTGVAQGACNFGGVCANSNVNRYEIVNPSIDGLTIENIATTGQQIIGIWAAKNAYIKNVILKNCQANYGIWSIYYPNQPDNVDITIEQPVVENCNFNTFLKDDKNVINIIPVPVDPDPPIDPDPPVYPDINEKVDKLIIEVAKLNVDVAKLTEDVEQLKTSQGVLVNRINAIDGQLDELSTKTNLLMVKQQQTTERLDVTDAKIVDISNEQNTMNNKLNLLDAKINTKAPADHGHDADIHIGPATA